MNTYIIWGHIGTNIPNEKLHHYVYLKILIFPRKSVFLRTAIYSYDEWNKKKVILQTFFPSLSFQELHLGCLT